MSSRLITISGKLPEIAKESANRVAVYLFSGNKLLADVPAQSGGNVKFHVSEDVLAGADDLKAVVAPAGLSGHALAERSDLISVPIDRQKVDRDKALLEFPLAKIVLKPEIIDKWWLWCRQYCVDGTVVGPDGCPVPGAQVTVYSVAHTGWFGYSKTPKRTVSTGPDGKFHACFNWCTCRFCLPCWPCWPVWWSCWPWWWELDLLHVLDHVETRATLNAGVAGRIATDARRAPLSRPATKDLMVGRGFAALHKQDLVPDENRTRLIQRKLANPAIREIFPWAWWCCDDPNIVFSVSQNGTVIVDENPATDTRWCFEDGGSVTLVGNSSTISACNPAQPPPEGFTWIQVGNTLVSHINVGYANGTLGADASDMAFAGNLQIHGAFSTTQSIAFYQVLVGQWAGTRNPRRDGVGPAITPTLFAPFTGELLKYVSIFRGASFTVDQIQVKMGPCSFAGLDNLYLTEAQRPNPPAGVVGLDPFPVVNAGDFIIGWSDVDVRVNAAAGSLLAGTTAGAVDLTTKSYTIAGVEVHMVTNLPLTLMIDTTDISAHILSLTAFDQSHNQVFLDPGSNDTCPAFNIGPHGYVLLHVMVTDPNLHLFEYAIETEFGHGSTVVPTDPVRRGYRQLPASFTTVDGGYLVPDTAHVAFGGGGDTIKISPEVNCCYDFRLNAGKRVTDGHSFFSTYGNRDFQTATLKVS
ncbi:MAG TPA: hypothetical protein VIX89_12085 [Bryobacteraceae bacterium]